MSNGKKPESPWTGLLKDAAKQLLPLLLTGASLIGFVAFAGAVIVWTRFDAIEVPADQAVKAVPQAELVATGSSVLLIFGFFGVLAIIAAYLIDRSGRATPGMNRALLVLLAVEGCTAIRIFDSEDVAAVIVFLLLVALALMITFHRYFARYVDQLPSRPSETLGPSRGLALLRTDAGELRITGRELVALSILAAPVAVLGAALILVDSVPIKVIIVALLLFVGAPFMIFFSWVGVKAGGSLRVDWRARRARAESEERRLEESREDLREKARTAKRRPHRLKVTPPGIAVLAGLGVLAVVVPCAILQSWWLAISLGAAIVLALGLWRIAEVTKANFMWYGLMVFISVPLFGTLTLMAHNISNPQVQPLALIRSTDGPDEAIQGIYVTEGSDRVYFADVATEGCSDDLTPNGGRLLWVPKSEVVAMDVGPLQGIEDVAKSALEMAYTLTPSVETPAAGAVSLTVPEKKSKELEKAEEARAAKEAEAHAPQLDQRLENPGPAVRPNFGSGLSLVPEIALPGETVELRLSVPNRNSGGFGPTPHGRTLRLNGAPVAIARELAATLPEVEFVKTEEGQALSLDKQGRYGAWAKSPYSPKPFLLTPGNHYHGPRYVRLMDGQVSAVTGGGFPGTEYSQFLRIRINEKDQPVLEGEPKVTLTQGAEPIALEPGFQRQAWDRDRISFEVPEHASSGVITVDCGQLAGQPLLRVAEPPSARIAVRMQPGSNRVAFDGTRSRAATGGALAERWKIGTQVVGRGPRMTLALPPRNSPYEIQLAVTDAHGKVDTAELTLLRLPAPLFAFDGAVPRRLDRVAEERRILARVVRRHPPASIEVDGNADDPGSDSYNDELSLRRAENLREALLVGKGEASASAPASAAAPPPVPVTIRALGESCPIVPGGGRQPANRRVEVFVLDPGVSVRIPSSCKAGKVEHTTW